ncbi:MAG: OmpH family outer membrane protein [Planctomycetota bacterium]|nr:OmpH family outer membrane protein [Planctomycetota bacterium]
MLTRTFVPLFVFGLFVSAGCGNQGSGGPQAQTGKSNGGVGVVDLDGVAKALGRDMTMESDAEQKLAQLNEELTALQEALNKQFADKREELGEDLTDDDKRQLLVAKNKLEIQFRDKKLAAERKLLTHKQKLLGQFREETKPILKELAAERGLSIVIPKDPMLLLTVTPEYDLTDAVVVQMQKLQSTKPATADATPAKSKRKQPEAETSLRD